MSLFTLCVSVLIRTVSIGPAVRLDHVIARFGDGHLTRDHHLTRAIEFGHVSTVSVAPICKCEPANNTCLHRTEMCTLQNNNTRDIRTRSCRVPHADPHRCCKHTSIIVQISTTPKQQPEKMQRTHTHTHTHQPTNTHKLPTRAIGTPRTMHRRMCTPADRSHG